MLEGLKGLFLYPTRLQQRYEKWRAVKLKIYIKAYFFNSAFFKD